MEAKPEGKGDYSLGRFSEVGFRVGIPLKSMESHIESEFWGEPFPLSCSSPRVPSSDRARMRASGGDGK